MSIHSEKRHALKTTFWALAFLVGATGCAALRGAAAKNAHIEKATMSHVYSKPCGDVWAAARTMLFARDYQVKSADAAAGLTLETEWKVTNATGTRYLFQGSAPEENTCQVVATRATKDAQGNTSTARDWQMEWDLLQQVDPAAATRIDADGEKAAEAARNAN